MKFHLLIAALLGATFAFTSCGGSDDEPSVDEILSEETTPIDFKIENYYSGVKYTLYDYAGGRYVEKKTTSGPTCTVDLRQGKHHIVWIGGLSDGVAYDPQSKTFSMSEYGMMNGVEYFEKDIEVTPYLMPVQNVKFDKYVNAALRVVITDNKYKQGDWRHGKLTGLPYVKTVSLTGEDYELGDYKIPLIQNMEDYILGISEFIILTLCPLKGIDNIQLYADIPGADGTPVQTTAIPKFSLRRGTVTTLTGPLFSGNASDWTVTMESD